MTGLPIVLIVLVAWLVLDAMLVGAWCWVVRRSERRGTGNVAGRGVRS